MGRRRLGFWRRFAVATVEPPVALLTKRDWRGVQHIPASGGVILVPNHISQFDPFAVAHFVYEAGRWPRFLGKSSLFEIPILGWLLHQLGQIPVRRGTADAARALDAAVAAVRTGCAVIIYPEGTTTREPDLWPMHGKTGVARLALATGAPVVPIVQWGAQRLFDPRTRRLRPWPHTPVAIVAGPPVDLSAWAAQPPSGQTLHEMTDAIMLRIRDMLAEIRGGTPPPLWSAGARPGGIAAPGTATGIGVGAAGVTEAVAVRTETEERS